MNNPFDISGCWRGIATSSVAVFHYHWCLQQTGDEVSGVISICLPDKSRRGSYHMRGLLRGDTLQFQGTDFIENPGIWCMAAGLLHYALAAESVPELRGYWGPLAIPGGCPPGCRGGVILRRA